jgi:chromosomal replication initiator protein
MGSATGMDESKLRAAVAERIGDAKFGLWFGEGVRLGVDGDSLFVGVPNGFFREWIQSHYSENLLDAARAVLGRPLRLDFRIDAEAEPKPKDVIEVTPGGGRKTGPLVTIPTKPSPSNPTQQPERERPTRNQARPPKRLEEFVVGQCNRLAHAAAVEMSHSSGSAFNPLVVHGAVGLGKTHLLEGIGASLRLRHPGINVAHVTAESFTNGFLDSMRAGSLASFRGKYRKAGALIVDDVHFLAGTRATQNEFLHTFNALISAGAPIIVSCDQHPRLINKLMDELVTRFLGGMVVRLDPPDLDTRCALLKAKAAARRVDVPDPVIWYVAEHLRASVRELEGALHSLLAHATLTGKRLDLNLAKSALRDMIRHTAQAVALKDVERAICGLFGIDPEALRSDGRARSLAHPRMLAMYLARKHTGAAYSEIGRFFGGRNHSTVIAAEKKVAGWLQEEQRHGLLAGFESVADVLATLERQLGA